MTMKRQLGWQKLLLILTVLPCYKSLEVSTPQTEYEVAKGGDITMTCSFRPARPVTNMIVLTWEAYPDAIDGTMQPVATFFLNNPIDIAPAYEGRAFLEVNVDNDVSTLRLTKVTIEDSRRYLCSVMIPNDDEGTTAATTSLLVLVPPSPPVCKIQGKAEYGQNITLTCLSEEGSPKPVAAWKSYSVNNIARPFPPKTTEKDGALSLFNVSRETSGFFICTSTNRIGSASCNLTLAVVPPSMNIGSTVGIIVGVFAGVVVLGIVIYCCRRKAKKNKNVEGPPEEVFYDRDAPESGEPYRDEKSKSETKELNQHEEKDIVPQNNYSVGTAARFDDEQRSYNSGKDRHDGKGSDIDSRHYKDDQQDHYHGSRDRLDDKRYQNSGSRDRLDDQRERYGSRDRLDDQRGRSGSRDRLDDQRGRSGSRDRLDDQRGRSGSRDRLDDQRDRYSSRDRLDDQRDHYSSRDRLDDQRERYGSRDRLDDHSDRYHSDRSDRHGGSRDRLDYADDQY